MSTRRFGSLIFGLVVFAGSGRAMAQHAVDLHDVRQNLFAACMATDTTGWMVGELGRIFRTEDAGKTWVRQDAGTKRPFLAVACLDAQTAFVSATQGAAYRSSDGGKTWSKVDTGSDRHVFALQFATPLRGHGAGDFGRMIHTEDGGKTWTHEQIPTSIQLPESALDTGVDPGDVNIYGLSYGTPERAWMVGEFGIAMRSEDGGLTWHQQKTPVETTLFGAHFMDANNGWIVGGDSTILRTTDGGDSWTPQHSPLAARPFYDVMVRGQNGWIVGESGAMLKSIDGGNTWAAEPLPIQLAARWIRAVTLIGKGFGFAVGAEGLVYKLNGGTAERLGERAS